MEEYENILMTVTGYDLNKNMILTQWGNKACAIVINKEYYKEQQFRAVKSEMKNPDVDRKWYGHKIDATMQSSLPLGSEIIVERAKTIETKDNITMMEADLIIGVVTDKNLSFKGLFSSPPVVSHPAKITKWVQK